MRINNSKTKFMVINGTAADREDKLEQYED